MDCKLCQEKVEAYLGGQLTQDMKIQVESHIETCEECAVLLKIMSLTDGIIGKEKEIEPDPFLTERIMARLELNNNRHLKGSQSITRVLRPALIAVSVAAAIFTGIFIGSINSYPYRGKEIPVELALIDDISMESLGLLSEE